MKLDRAGPLELETVGLQLLKLPQPLWLPETVGKFGTL